MAVSAVATYSGRTILWENMLKSASATTALNLGWGVGSGLVNNTVTVTGSANSNINLFGPATEARTAGTPALITSTALGDTFRVIGTITCATASKTITEVGLFDGTTLSNTSTLAASLASGATTMTLAAQIGPSTANYYAQVGLETILVTGASSLTFTISRAQLSSATAASAWISGTAVTIGGDGTNGVSATSLTTGQTIAGSLVESYGGNMFVHADFAGIALNVNDSIAFTITDTLT
jgi:hypothetical protein